MFEPAVVQTRERALTNAKTTKKFYAEVCIILIGNALRGEGERERE